VKYADGPTTEQQIDIRASPAEVWAIVSDPTFPVHQSTELQEAAWDPDGPAPGLGARILGRNHHDRIGEWRTTSTIVEWSEGSICSWAVNDPSDPAAQWWFEIEPIAEGVTLRQRVRIGPGRSGLSPAIERMPDREDEIVENRLRFHEMNMQANLEAVKLRVEGR